MAITYSNVQVTKVLTLRGNTIQNNRYTGLPGELTVDTEAKTIRIHDGVTPGGNTVQGGSSASSYANANVKVYLTQFNGNIIPSANVTYTLGNITHQWRDLFVSNNTIYVGGVPLGIDSTGNLTVNGNIIPTIGYVNAQVANVVVDLSSYALNANVTAANVGLKGYVDQANSIQSSAISSANIAIKGYIDQQITDLIGGAPSILDTLNEIAASINDDANVYTSLINSIATANTALKGYVDQANTIQSSQLTSANLGIIGYIDQANTIQSAQVGAANLAITAANVGMRGYVDSQSFYSNVKVATYLPTYDGNIAANIVGTQSNVTLQAGTFTSVFNNQGNVTMPNVYVSGNVTTGGYFIGNGALLTGITAGSSYSNVQVATYLPTYDGNIAANISKAGYTWTFGGAGNLTLPYGAVIRDSSINTLAIGTDAGNVTNTQDGAIAIGYLAGSDAQNYDAVAIGSSAGGGGSGYYSPQGQEAVAVGSGAGMQSQGIYSVAVGSSAGGNLQSTWGVAVGHLAGETIQAIGAVAVGASAGYIGQGAYAVAIGNKAGVTNQGNNSIIINATGNILNQTTANTFTVAPIRTDSGNVAQALYYNTTTKEVTYANVTAGSYSNVQVATYLPTYDGVVTAGNVAVNGNVTAQYFLGNGALLTGIVAGAGNYGNIDVKAFLETDAGPGDGFQRVIEGYYANLILGDTTKLFSFGNSSKSYFGHDGFANININYVRADNSDVRIATNNGAHAWIFSNAGNLTLPAGGRILESTYLSADSIRLKPNGGTSSQYLEIAPTAVDGNHVHLMTGGGTELFLGDDNHYVKLANTGGVVINSNDGIGNTAQWTFGKTGTTQFPGSKILAPAGESITMQSDNYSQLMWENANVTVAPNMAINSNFYVAQNNATLDIGYRDGSSTQLIKSWYWNVDGNLKLPSGGYILNSDDSIYGGGSSYSNVEVAAYLPTYSGNIANITLGPSGVLTFADGTTQITAGGGSYSNVQVATYLPTYAGTVSASLVNTSGNILSSGLSVFGNTRIGLAGTVSGQFHSVVGNITQTSSGGAVYINTTGNVLAAAVVTGAVTSTGTVAVNAATGITTNQTTFLLANASATTINMGGAATTINLGTTASATGNVFVGGQIGSNAYNLTLRANGRYNVATSIDSNGGFNSPPYANQAVIGGTGTGMTANYSATGGYLTTLTIYNSGTGYRNGDVISVPGGVAGNSFVLQNYSPSRVGAFTGTALYTFGIDGNLTAPGNISISSGSSYFLGNSVGTTAAYTGNVSANYFLGNGTLLTGVATKITGSWTVPTGNSTQSFTVASGTYQLWVDCNIPNGILAWNATATVTNSNVPVVGQQFAWVYDGGGTPIDFTSIPNQFVGTGNTIVRSSVSPSVTTNRFDFGINNTSGGNVTVSYGYVKIS